MQPNLIIVVGKGGAMGTADTRLSQGSYRGPEYGPLPSLKFPNYGCLGRIRSYKGYLRGAVFRAHFKGPCISPKN